MNNTGDAPRIGTFTTNRMRIYPLDAAVSAPACTEVVVQAGEWPIYSDGYSTWVMLTGRINMRFVNRGDGMFTVRPGDDPSGPEVTFPSRFWGPDEWDDMLNTVSTAWSIELGETDV